MSAKPEFPSAAPEAARLDVPVPGQRPRRLRRGRLLRDSVADVALAPADLVLPLFVRAGDRLDRPIASMPGVAQMSPDVAAARIADLSAAGLERFILFGVVDAHDKDAVGSPAFDEGNPVNDTLRRVRDAGTEALMVADLCFCEYTHHGHCGALDSDDAVTVDNDVTLEMLGRQAQVLARCGADVVAPSGMMDGQVRAIRSALDADGFEQTAIMSYSIKFASGF